jgi:nicotinate phosphoribosyltransferase
MKPDPPVSLWPDPDALGLVTDLYELTMMAGYSAAGMGQAPAVFELFVRRLPPNRPYLVFAGLEQALADLQRLQFRDEQAAYLRALPEFRHVAPAWFDRLPDVRFHGDVWAMPEGTVCFAGETLLRVEGALAEAQWVETLLLASLAYPTMAASKAARVVEAAEGRPLYEFGARRGHGPQAGFLAARSSYLAGFHGTSHVEAARRLDIPAVGTMAHSWVQSFDTEVEAFREFSRTFPDATALLVDTYDTLEGVRNALAVGPSLRAVRLDSGDLGRLARESRAILDAAGRNDVRIMASGDLDERKIQALVHGGAPIDAFGVGTELITVRDAPAIGMVYKLVALKGRGRVKLSSGKRTYPLAKQVWRRRDCDGRFLGDHVTRADESSEGEPLLVPWMTGGRIARELPRLDAIRERCRAQLAALPVALRRLDGVAKYPISYSESLDAEAARLGILPEAR